MEPDSRSCIARRLMSKPRPGSDSIPAFPPPSYPRSISDVWVDLSAGQPVGEPGPTPDDLLPDPQDDASAADLLKAVEATLGSLEQPGDDENAYALLRLGRRTCFQVRLACFQCDCLLAFVRPP